MTKKLLMGNEAFAHAALEAGVNVVAGYPGTPSSEVVETVAAQVRSGAAKGVHVEWSTNEKAALEVLCGASYAGARVLFTCKQMGLNVAADALLSVNYVGIGGGMVLFVADDPGPISSQTEQDTRRFAAFAKVPVLDPATPEQGFEMMHVAFDLSEKYHTPVIVRPTTRVCHASTYFDVADTTSARTLPSEGFVKDPKWIIFPKRSFEAHGEIVERLGKIAHDFSVEPEFSRFNPQFVDGGIDSKPKLGIIAGGVSAAYARDALSMLEERAKKQSASEQTNPSCKNAKATTLPPYKFMQVGCVYPFPRQTVNAFVQDLDYVLVFEELDHVIEDELLKLTGKSHAKFDVLGKLTHHTLERGENSIDDCYARILAFFETYGCSGDTNFIAKELEDSYTSEITTDCACEIANCSDKTSDRLVDKFNKHALNTATLDMDERSVSNLPVRPPVLCAGCPHRGSFYAIKRALGKREAVYCGDIGCYTLGNAAPLNTTDTCLCMGAGITMAQGFHVVEPHKKQVAFVGDSTFFASGMTGVANAVYNQHDITIAVLDNSTTAMTGGQPHPGTGVPLMSGCAHENTVHNGTKHDKDKQEANKCSSTPHPISIHAVLEALGVECIVHADPLNHEEACEAAKTALDFEGPSAIIFKSPCVQLVRGGKPVTINTNKCTGCKKCITEIGCPGIAFKTSNIHNKRGYAYINPTQCNGCGLCVQICPFGAIEGATSGENKSATENTNENAENDTNTNTTEKPYKRSEK